MTEPMSRRPIKQRESGWAKWMAATLGRMGVSPNQVSVASMVFGASAGTLFFLSPDLEPVSRTLALLGAVLSCQMRLLCNLFDGMIAVEGGKSTPDGPFWNEFPDRVSDVLILAGAGYGAGVPELGWAAAALAVMTAYVRELGHANGLAPDFAGPLAKQGRMHLVSLGAIAAIFDATWGFDQSALAIALAAIALGSALTVLNRSQRMVRQMKK
ncbi:MAG: CDP-alcohol phosphatidyltransferase family protein [Hyphomonadaceae bacterium]|nr:CDP-alcohol phosphatidyltransferase family protein [Hyphomonadaceae bacterium]